LSKQLYPTPLFFKLNLYYQISFQTIFLKKLFSLTKYFLPLFSKSKEKTIKTSSLEF